MAYQSKATGLKEVSDLVEKNAGRIFWDGELSSSIYAEIRDLPLAIPQAQSYLFTAEGKTLYLASLDAGISSFRVVADKLAQMTTEITADGVAISGFGSRKFDRLVIQKEPTTLSIGAVTIDSLVAPISLLDQYAALRNKQSAGRMSEEDQVRRSELLKQIRKEYERGTSSLSSSYGGISGSSSSGESRGSSYGRGG